MGTRTRFSCLPQMRNDCDDINLHAQIKLNSFLRCNVVPLWLLAMLFVALLCRHLQEYIPLLSKLPTISRNVQALVEEFK